jgi:hypothetical protein
MDVPSAAQRASRRLEDLARIFTWFGDVECPQVDGVLYRALCRGIAGDDALLAIAARAPASQPPPNLLFAAVHALLLGGARHPLRAWYPALCDLRAQDPEEAFPAFRDFCLQHREAIEARVATRLTQTNVLQRCSVLLPAFAQVHAMGGGRPLALVEVGASAGLNMRWDGYRYAYAREEPGAPDLAWGDPTSGVVVSCVLRGPHLPPLPPADVDVAWRRGIDLHPIDLCDDDAVTWLRALVWPDHAGRQERLSAALEAARRDPPDVRAGDASVRLPELLEAAPGATTLCVYGTHTLYQWPRDALRRGLQAMQTGSRVRPVHFLSVEGTGRGHSELRHTLYRDGERETHLWARCCSHGRWIEWLWPPAGEAQPGGEAPPSSGGTVPSEA